MLRVFRPVHHEQQRILTRAFLVRWFQRASLEVRMNVVLTYL